MYPFATIQLVCQQIFRGYTPGYLCLVALVKIWSRVARIWRTRLPGLTKNRLGNKVSGFHLNRLHQCTKGVSTSRVTSLSLYRLGVTSHLVVTLRIGSLG